MTARHQKTGEKAISRQENRRRAVELRKTGATYQQIAETMGITNASMAHKLVKEAMDLIIREPTQDLIDLEVLRLDGMLVAISKSLKAGHLGAIDRGIRIMERRAKLLGLDARTDPTMVVNTAHALIDTDRMTDEQREAFYANLAARKAELDAAATPS